jgi:hypothetical protein
LVFSPFPNSLSSNQINNPFLSLDVGFDVALGGCERSVSSQHLNVLSEPPTIEILRAALVMNVRRPE